GGVRRTGRGDNARHEAGVRRRGVLPGEMQEGRRPARPPRPPGPQPRPGEPRPGEPRPDTPAPGKESPALKLYQAKPGFANYYFNELAQQKLLAPFAKHAPFTPLTAPSPIHRALHPTA